MANAVYTLDGIPSDVLTGVMGDRKLKIAGTFQSAGASALDTLATKSFTWNEDGSVDTITITDATSGGKTLKSFSYNPDGTFLNIIVTAI